VREGWREGERERERDLESLAGGGTQILLSVLLRQIINAFVSRRVHFAARVLETQHKLPTYNREVYIYIYIYIEAQQTAATRRPDAVPLRLYPETPYGGVQGVGIDPVQILRAGQQRQA
jgi:hypothetical protein